MFHRSKDKHIDQYNQIESLEIHSHIFFFFFDKGAKAIQWEK